MFPAESGRNLMMVHALVAVSFGGVALLFLGLGLLGQVAISAYCLYGAVDRKILS